MRKSISLRAFPTGMPTLQRAQIARDAGFDGVEINLEPAEDVDLDSSPEELQSLRREIEALGLVVSAVYCRDQWHHPITSQNPATRQAGIRIVEQLVNAAAHLGADNVLVLPGAVDNRIFVNPPEIVPYAVAYQNAQAALRELAHGPAAANGVHLAIENVWNKFLLSPLEFARFIDEIESPWASAYFDVGNVLRYGFPDDWIRILGPRIVNVQVKDFRRDVDTLAGFVGLLQGDVDWPAVRLALEDIGYDRWLTSEVLPAYKFHSERLIYEASAAMDAIFQPNGAHSVRRTQ
jgi:hexulose-6-phosphate isomerase